MKGLTLNTKNIFNYVSRMDSIKEYSLIGGTALSLQINHRLSEDLDFCKWKLSKFDKPTINISFIEKELNDIGTIYKKNILDFNQVDFIINDVKVSFYANQLYKSPIKNHILLKNNLKVADIESIGIMKLELILRRRTFKDYYDLYSILKEGVLLKNLIEGAVKYSNYNLKSKNILLFISNGSNYIKEKKFTKLSPKYDVDEKIIESFLKNAIIKEFSQ
ncbi:MAG: nucleotidyl transferase AbiEii/AbiGii toxin family protein [Bacteroidales bacterium]|nr:nucleotidyl transferase AbiEii/AbiGii toxin family protein [Bacteroidales bacterium]